MKTLYHEDLEKIKCSDPKCPCGDDPNHPVYLSTRCHHTTHVKASYNKKTRLLEIECGVCGKPVIQIAVAERLPSAYALAE
jgi:hypothetical protein